MPDQKFKISKKNDKANEIHLHLELCLNFCILLEATKERKIRKARESQTQRGREGGRTRERERERRRDQEGRKAVEVRNAEEGMFL